VKKQKEKGGPMKTESPMIAILLTLFLILLAAPGQAASPDHLTLEEIVVTDSISSDPAATVVGKKTIERGKNINIPDALQYEPEIQINKRAGVGDAADILSIRGLSANRIMLNINGRPVNAAGVVGGYYIDWGTIPLDNIERIEIIKGGSSVIYGNNALGGVVNVITKRPTEKPTLSFYGNYGLDQGGKNVQNWRLGFTHKIGPLGYSLASSYEKADAFLWNNDLEAKNFAGSLYLDMPLRGELSMGLQYDDTRRGFIRQNRASLDPDNPLFNQVRNANYPLAFGETIAPGAGRAFTPGPGSYWDKTKYYLDLGYKQPIKDTLLEIKFYKNYEDRNEKNYSSAAVVAGYTDGRLVLDRKVESDRSYGGIMKATHQWGLHELVGGIDYKVLAYGNTVLNYVDTVYNGMPYTGSAPSQEGIMWGYYGQDTWRISDRFTLTGGFRYDTYDIRPINNMPIAELKDEAISPKATGTYKITDADVLTLSLYRAVRTPGIPETYWWYNGQTHGNPVLKSEKNNAAELVYQHQFTPKNSLKFSGFYYSISDFIIFRNDPNWRGVYNINKATLTGFSAEGKAELLSWLNGSASLTYLKTKKEGDPYDTSHLSDELDYRPEWISTVGLEFKLPYHSVLNTSLKYVGQQKTIYAYTVNNQTSFKLMNLDSFITADAELKIPIVKNTEAVLYVNNLFDKTYQEVLGYPLPGRIIGGAIKFTF
jgi:outer membrane receptor protein involved in Fe transport